MPSQPSGSTEPLTDALDDDTFLKRTLGQALLGAREIVGWERYTECLRRLKRSDELVVASCLEAAEALARPWGSGRKMSATEIGRRL